MFSARQAELPLVSDYLNGPKKYELPMRENGQHTLRESYLQSRESQQRPQVNPEEAYNQSRQYAQQHQRTSSTGSLPAGKRPLPIRPKEKVFNEWAAILQHQDEIEQARSAQDKDQHRQRQMMYRQELDSQRESLVMDKLKKMQADRSIEKQSLIYQQRQEEARKLKEEANRNKLKDEIKQKQNQGLVDQWGARANERGRLMEENENAKQNILQKQASERQQIQQEKEEKVNQQHSYLADLKMQQQLKQNERLNFKHQEKYYALAEQDKLQKEDQGRQNYFNNLKMYQDKNDAKNKALSAFLNNQSMASLAARDEQAYVKAVVDKEEKDAKNEQSQQMRVNHTKRATNDELQRQIKEKEAAKQMKRVEEQSYANQVAQRNQEQLQREQEDRNLAKMRQRAYQKSLDSQIAAQGMKHKYDTLMTEHERLVNDKDIQAYQVQDVSTLNAKIPGFKPINQAQDQSQKYLNRLYQGNGLNAEVAQPPTLSMLQSATPNQSPMRRGGNGRSTLALGGQSLITNRSIDASQYEEARRNMEQPEALRFRHNTGNRAYGFEQTLNDDAPPKNEGGEYRFSVAGNQRRVGGRYM